MYESAGFFPWPEKWVSEAPWLQNQFSVPLISDLHLLSEFEHTSSLLKYKVGKVFHFSIVSIQPLHNFKPDILLHLGYLSQNVKYKAIRSH